MSYTKLANSILTSTIWMETDHTRLVWLTMLAMADKNGEVQASIPGLANVARVPVDSCRSAIAVFLAPDPDSRTKDDEGRRIEVIDGGWVLINHAKYRELASDDDRREKAAIRQKRFREKAKRNASPDDSNAPVTQVSHQIPQGSCDKSRQIPQAESKSREQIAEEREPQSQTHFPEAHSPSWEEFWCYLNTQECLLPAEWYAKDKFQAAEQDHWKGKSNWKAYARRCKTWWESDGRPMHPAPKKNGHQPYKRDWNATKITDCL